MFGNVFMFIFDKLLGFGGRLIFLVDGFLLVLFLRRDDLFLELYHFNHFGFKTVVFPSLIDFIVLLHFILYIL